MYYYHNLFIQLVKRAFIENTEQCTDVIFYNIKDICIHKHKYLIFDTKLLPLLTCLPSLHSHKHPPFTYFEF